MTTEIHRLPGVFNLAADWPQVSLGNLTTGLWGDWVADDATPTDPAALQPGSAMVLPWNSRTGTLNLTGTAQTVPNVAQYPDRFKGHKYSSWPSDTLSLRTDVLASPYAGALTMTGHLYTAQLVDRWLLHTGTGTDDFFGIQVNRGTYGVRMFTGNGAGTTAPNESISAPIPDQVGTPFVACFNGPNSYIRVGDVTSTGALTAPGAVTRVNIGRDATAAGLSYYGRIPHLRLYKRALTHDEADLTVKEMRELYG